MPLRVNTILSSTGTYLSLLAPLYADHPDYRTEGRPPHDRVIRPSAEATCFSENRGRPELARAAGLSLSAPREARLEPPDAIGAILPTYFGGRPE